MGGGLVVGCEPQGSRGDEDDVVLKGDCCPKGSIVDEGVGSVG